MLRAGCGIRQLLGHSMYFSTKDVGVPVKFTAPSWALKDITKIPRYRQFNTNMQGCNFWWLEYGGRLDTIHQTEEIKWELWKVVYGVWDYIKNSGNFPEAETMTLEWVGHVPGKRESRRFEGDYLIRQQDLVEQREFDDVVAHGGWAVDLHPADGVYSEKNGCTQWHSKGVYGIPWRCYYSRYIKNLLLAGRIISATHVAFGSTRVMATCAAGGQAVGIAAALCLEQGCQPIDLSQLDERLISAEQSGALRVELRRSVKSGNFTPEELVEAIDIPFSEGISPITARFAMPLAKDGYHFVKLCQDPSVRVRVSDMRLTGVLAVTTAFNKAVASSSVQEPPQGIGIDRFEFWLPKRRPEGRNLAMSFEPPLDHFGPANVIGGPARPVDGPNAWIADPADSKPELHLDWDAPCALGRVRIEFDPDWDHPMESVLMTHPEEVVPFMVKDFDLLDDHGNLVHSVRDHRGASHEWQPEQPLATKRLTLRVLTTHGAPAAVFRVSCFTR
jgi:hypothetical protein